MKIETATDSRMEFKQIKSGKCFKSRGTVYMKTKVDIVSFVAGTGSHLNAVDLKDGQLVHFGEEAMVLPIGAKVTIY